MKPPSPRSALALAIAIVALHLVAAGFLASITPWTPDERGYLASGRNLVLGADWEVPEQRFQGPLGLLANQLFVDSAALDPFAPDDARVPARLGMLVFPALLLAVVGAWAWQAFGAGAAVVALLLAATNPTLLAYGHLLAVDVALTALATTSFWLTWRWLSTPSVPRLLVMAVALGGMLATKYTGLLLVLAVPLSAVIATLAGADLTPWAAGSSRRPLHSRALGALAALGLVGLVTLAVLHACYLLRAPFYSASEVGSLTSGVLRALAAVPGGSVLLGLLPEPFVLGADFQATVSRALTGTFLDYDHSHWAYYPMSLLTKTPLALLGMWGLSLVARPRVPRFAGLSLAVPAVVLLGYLSVASALQMGIRYLLPVIPLLAIRAGGLAASGWARRPVGGIVVALGCVAAVGAAALSWPQYIGYFNATVGGPAGGFRLFADGNCDWHQRFDAGQVALRSRHPDVQFLRPGEGPRVRGKIAAYALDLKPSDPERDGRTYHWVTRFPVVDHDTAAWLLFDVSPEHYEAAVRRGDTRAARDLALAWLRERDPAQARLALASIPATPRSRELLEIVERIERALAGDTAARREAIARLSAAGHAELAMHYVGDAPRSELPELFVLMVRSGRLTDAVDVLESRAEKGPLTPIEALLLGAGRFWQGDPVGALAVMERGPAPTDDHPLAASWRTFFEQVKNGALAVEKLRGPRDQTDR